MNSRNKSESRDLEVKLKKQWNTDKMNRLQSAGMVVNQDEEDTVESLNEQDADIVDSW
jgi:hypothetical protein